MDDWLKAKLERLSKMTFPSGEEIKDPVERAKRDARIRNMERMARELGEAMDACKPFLEEIRRRKMNSPTRH